MTMFNWADYTILGVVGFSTVVSLARGFVRESLSLITWVIAFWVAFNFATQLATLLTGYIQSPSLRILAGFGILFVATLILGAIVNYILGQLVDKTGLSGTDRVLGLVFGAARGMLVITVLLMLARLTPMPEEPWWEASLLISYFHPLEIWLHGVLPDSILEHLPKGLQAIYQTPLAVGAAN